MARSRPASPPHPFQALYRLHYGFVWHAVHRFGVEPPLTDDAVQDTFVAAYRRFDEIAIPSAKSWLYGVARRVASNYRRADHRSERKRSAIAIANASPSAQRPELLVELDRFLASLSAEDRELFMLSEIEGMSGPEAAQALTLNLSTTYSRVQSLRKRFRARLGEASPREVRRAARAERPRATAQGWALLWTKLGVATATKASPVVGVGVVTKLAALALPIAVVVAVAVMPSQPAPRETIATAAVVEEPIAAAPVDTTPASDRAIAVEHAPAIAAASLGEPAAVRREAPTPAPTLPARHSLASASSALVPLPPAAASPTPASLARQNQMLVDAAGHLRDGASEEALAIVDQHAAEFPDGPLADARTALRIEALCMAGKTAQARGEARVFLRAHPRSLVRARIERSCVGTVVDSEANGQ
jgi:RNA polymerase sigma factor (sigma-70 family)